MSISPNSTSIENLFYDFREPPQTRHLNHHRRYRGNNHNLRRFETQLVSGSSDTYKYIPLHTKPPIRPSRLWWQPLTIDIPSSYSTVTIVNSAESTNSEEDPEIQLEETSTTQQDIVEEGTEEIDEDQTTLIPRADDDNDDEFEYDSSTMSYEEEEYFNGDTTTPTEIIQTTTIAY